MYVVLFLIGVLVTLWYRRERGNAKRRLPGPMQFPIVGSAIQVALQHRTGFIALHKLSKKYGPVMALKLGVVDFVFVSSFESIKTFYTADEFADRPCTGVWAERNFYKKLGLIFSNGHIFNEVKKFCDQCMRSFGFLNPSWSKTILEQELKHFLAHLDEEIASSPNQVVEFTPSGSVKASFSNLICAVVNGKRHDYEEEEFQKLIKALEKFMRSSTQGLAIMTSFPISRFLFGRYFARQNYVLAS